MANRYYRNVAFTLAPAVVKIFAKVTFGGGGSATLSTTGSNGIVSVTHDATGKYTFVFGTQSGMLDVYPGFLNAQVCFDTSGASSNPPASPIMSVIANNSATAGTASIQVLLSDVETPAATDPASGEIGYFEFTFKNSTAT